MKNIELFARRFNAAYARLHDGEITAPGAVDTFDSALAGDPNFRAAVLEFNAYRRDIISSDREAAAFWLAWKEVG